MFTVNGKRDLNAVTVALSYSVTVKVLFPIFIFILLPVEFILLLLVDVTVFLEQDAQLTRGTAKKARKSRRFISYNLK
jgi:hypothetical protein